MLEQEKVELAISLYESRNDVRLEAVVSEDEVAPSVRSSVVAAMVSLTDYEKILNEGKKIDYSDPFRPHDLSDFVESDFFRWFEENYLRINSDKNLKRTNDWSQDPNSINQSASQKQRESFKNAKEKLHNLRWLYWVLGPLILGGVVKLVLNGHKK